MHELSLCKRIIEIIEETLASLPGKKVKRIALEIGELVGIDQDTLLFSFDVVTQGTVVQGALVDVITVPGRAKCEVCQQITHLHRYGDNCKTCGNSLLTVLDGNELRVKSMEVI